MNKEYYIPIMSRMWLLATMLIFIIPTAFSQGSIVNEGLNIRLNQVGFYPEAAKTGIVLNSKSDTFYIQTLDKKNAFVGKLKKSGKPGLNGNFTAIADFTAYNKPGKYLLYVPGSGYS